MTTTPVAAPPQQPEHKMETWEMRAEGRVILNVLKANRFGVPIESQLTIGPNRRGYRFEISPDDRKENQQLVMDAQHDPFRNGLLLRVDQAQNADPETVSAVALSDDEMLSIIDLPEEEFRTKVASLNEVATRQVRDLATAAGASHGKVTWLDEHIREAYAKGAPQQSITDDTKSERLS